MQLWEKGKFELDDDINQYLPFPVRNPSHPDSPISFRSLLTHRSSIADSPAYGSSYACGDPGVSLETWIKEYFTPDGCDRRMMSAGIQAEKCSCQEKPFPKPNWDGFP
jgi:hypothetical protein